MYYSLHYIYYLLQRYYESSYAHILSATLGDMENK